MCCTFDALVGLYRLEAFSGTFFIQLRSRIHILKMLVKSWEKILDYVLDCAFIYDINSIRQD